MLTQEQWDNMRPSLEDMNFRMQKMKEGLNRAVPRIQHLYNSRLYVEAAMVDGQILEYMIRLLLRAYKAKSGVLRELGMPDEFAEAAEKISEETIDKDTLGGLIGKLKRFTGEIPFTEKLDRFNKKFRKDFVHHAFFVSDEKLKELESEYENYMKGDGHRIMMQEMADFLAKAKEETIDLYERSMGLRPAKNLEQG